MFSAELFWDCKGADENDSLQEAINQTAIYLTYATRQFDVRVISRSKILDKAVDILRRHIY